MGGMYPCTDYLLVDLLFERDGWFRLAYDTICIADETYGNERCSICYCIDMGLARETMKKRHKSDITCV